MLEVILNENQIVEDALKNKKIDNNPKNTLKALMKHYYCKEGMTDKDKLKEQLIYFMKESYDGFIRSKWETCITNMVKSFFKDISRYKIEVKMVDIKEITITTKELEIISALDDLILEKIAFVMLVYAKISNKIMNNSEGWINKNSSVICKEAKVNSKGNDKLKALNKLYNLEYITQRNKTDKTNFKINYINDDSDIEIVINDFNNVIYEYILWKNKELIACENCGKPIKVTYNKKKYCSGCAKEIERINHKERNKKWYENKISDEIEKC
jgi:hypothetical protein